MREDYQESLEKMFPKGYVITFIQPNSDPAYSWFNPNEDEFIVDYLTMLANIFLEQEDQDE